MTDSHSESFLFYTALLANPSTGKSPAMRIFSEASYEIEDFLGIEEAKSGLANGNTNLKKIKVLKILIKGATVEALVEILKNVGPTLSLFDESSAFIGALGRYNNGGHSYDRGVFLQLFNGTTYNRDLKGSRTRLKNPKLNICLLGHPTSFIRIIREEIENFDDGLLQRFLFCSPDPLLNELDQIRARPQPEFSMTCILYVIYKFNERAQTYIFDSEAIKVYDSIYNKFRKIVKEANKIDSFIRFF